MAQEDKAHKLQIKSKPGTENRISGGATTEVWLDGQKLGGVSFLKFEIKAASVVKVMMELYCNVEVDAYVALTESEQPTNLELRGKPVVLKTLGNYAPAGIATTTCSNCTCKRGK